MGMTSGTSPGIMSCSARNGAPQAPSQRFYDLCSLQVMCAGNSDASKLLDELDVLTAKLRLVISFACKGMREEVYLGTRLDVCQLTDGEPHRWIIWSSKVRPSDAVNPTWIALHEVRFYMYIYKLYFISCSAIHVFFLIFLKVHIHV